MTVSIPHPVFDIAEAPTRIVGSAPPTSLPALLRELGLSHSSVEKQKVVLRHWLFVNTPPRSLRISLRENGYGLLLKETDEVRTSSSN
jgi:hypothetical protein